MSTYATLETERRSAIRDVLVHVWDPIGTADILRTLDKYDAYLDDIERLLGSEATDRSIASYLLWVETERMGLVLADSERRLVSVVRALRAVG